MEINWLNMKNNIFIPDADCPENTVYSLSPGQIILPRSMYNSYIKAFYNPITIKKWFGNKRKFMIKYNDKEIIRFKA